MDFTNVDEKTAFKMGFAAYCADHDLSKEAAEDLIKEGYGWAARSLGPLLKRIAGNPGSWQRFFSQLGGNIKIKPPVPPAGTGGGWGKWLLGTGVGLGGVGGYTLATVGRDAAMPLTALGAGIPVAASLAAGGGLGWGAAKLNEPDITPEDIQADELKRTYEQQTKRLASRRAYQQYRAARGMA